MLRLAAFALAAAAFTPQGRAQPIGFIDGIWRASDGYHVGGWACDPGSTAPVMVMVYGGDGMALAGALANAPNEPAVADACGAPGATTLRFDVLVPAWLEESVINSPLAMTATSNIGLWDDISGTWVYLQSYLANSGVFLFPDNRVRGVIDSTSFSGGTNQLVINGWACALGIPQSIWVHVYVGGPAGTGTFLTATPATLYNEPAVLNACGVSGGAYRFSSVTTFGPDLMIALGGKKVYVHGISPISGSNLLLDHSGWFALPGFQRSTYNGTSCGCLNAQWDAPRGSLVLIDSGANSTIKPIISNLGERYTHEMVVQGPGAASQSEYAGPKSTSDCDYPLDVNTLTVGFPGMEKSMNTGAIFADIYGKGQFTVNSSNVTWQLGDPVRANAIASALDARPAVDVLVHPGEYIHRVLHNGAVSPYGLYQYMNIEGTHLGEGGGSTNNTSVSSTFCAYAYALSGPPMRPYDYGHQETVNAANAFWDTVYNNCRAGLPFLVTSGLASIFNSSCQSSIICNNAAAMVLNCMTQGGSNCGLNNNFFWQATLTPAASHAHSISPDRLGGLTRFMHENPRPTTWAADPQHLLTWNWGGSVCGCFE